MELLLSEKDITIAIRSYLMTKGYDSSRLIINQSSSRNLLSLVPPKLECVAYNVVAVDKYKIIRESDIVSLEARVKELERKLEIKEAIINYKNNKTCN